MSCVVIKLGGGVITDKAQLKTVRRDVVDRCAAAVARVVASGWRVVLVHGAGSYGHIDAVRHALADGASDDLATLREQLSAVQRVRRSMLELNAVVAGALAAHGVASVAHPPSQEGWTGVGTDFSGDVRVLGGDGAAVHVSFGDVVDVPGPRRFGILSGDHIMVRLCAELPGVTHCVFLGDTPGLLTHPVGHPDGSILVERFRAPRQGEEEERGGSNGGVHGEHCAEQDATGGIFLKMRCAGDIVLGSPRCRDVWLLSGHHPERLEGLLETGQAVGTRVC